MPIKPENRLRYPANWKEIREQILARAGNCCEQCKVQNGTQILRGDGLFAGTFQTADADVFDAETGRYIGKVRMSVYQVKRTVNIVLTIAHLDHEPENCDPSNLRALCQMHHLRYDAAHHVETARETRRRALAISDLFDEPRQEKNLALGMQIAIPPTEEVAR
jgi:hypothetical protein